MVMTIAPQFEGKHALGAAFLDKKFIAFSIGAMLTGSLMFAALAGVGSVFRESRAADAGRMAIVMVAVLYGISYALGHPIPVKPQSRRQVPKLWREAFSPSVAAGLYGAGLGFGVLTRVPFVTLYVAMLCALFVSVSMAVLVGALFGLGRALPTVWYRARPPNDREPELVGRQVASRRSLVLRVNGVVLVATAAILAI